jgi:hypothetical protein
MVSQYSTSAPTDEPIAARRLQKRHTLAAVVYFLYGLFYFFGAQYLTHMRGMERSMANPTLFFVLGGVLTILLPLLIYSRCGLALSFARRAGRVTYFVNFTLILGLLVSARVAALLQGELYTKTPLHTVALVVAAVNAACLLWAGLNRPFWVHRHTSGV